MTQMPPVYDEVRAYLDQIRDLLERIDRSISRIDGKESHDRPAQPC